MKGLWDSGTEFVYDGVVGGIDLVGNAATWTYSKVGEFTYDTLHTFKMINDDMYYRGIDCYDNMSSISGQKIANWAGSIGPGIINNLTTTFNVNNFIEYLTTDDEQVIKDYSKSVIGTGTTIYGGYKLYKGAQNFVNNVNISTKQVPIGTVNNFDGTLLMSSITVPSISIVDTVALNTALIDVGVGTAAISTNGMSSSGNNKKDDNSNSSNPSNQFDLNDPESFRGSKLEDVEKFLDENLEGKTLGGKSLYIKDNIKKEMV